MEVFIQCARLALADRLQRLGLEQGGKCFESAGAHGTSAVTGPPGQSRRGSLQWMKVLHCQMSRWRHVCSRVS